MEFQKLLQKTKTFIIQHKFLIVLVSIGVFFSYLLFFQTFGYEDGNILINGKLHSDFTSHIHLIRSFSQSDNFPPEYPLFSGEKSKYHFLFYLIVGLIEKGGVRIDIALNTLSSIGFIGMLVGIYLLSYKITKDKLTSLIGAVLMLFNSSLSWIYFFSTNGPNISQLWTQSKFASFGPYDDRIISAFWNLNIFTNQRHLGLSFALLFAILFLFNSRKLKFIIIAVLLTGVMAWLHKAMLVVIFGYLLLQAVRSVKAFENYLVIIPATIWAVLPAVMYLSTSAFGSSGIQINPGFIFDATSWYEMPNLTNNFLKWLIYWYFNLGFLTLLSIAGWIQISKIRIKESIGILFKKLLSPKSIWFVLAIGIFVVANIFTFSADAATNHKLINFTIFVLNIYAAYFLVGLFKQDLANKIISSIFALLLILGGFIDIFPILNDTQHTIPDIQSDEVSTWIVANTDKKSKFLSFTYENQSIRLTGRSLYSGWPYFAWSLGYDTFSRDKEVLEIFSNQNKSEFCQFAAANGLDYIFVKPTVEEFLDTTIPKDFFNTNFHSVFANEQAIILDINSSCQ